MAIRRKPTKQNGPTQQPSQPAMPDHPNDSQSQGQPQPPRAQTSSFPDPQTTVKLPRRPFLAVVRGICLKGFRALFSPETGMFVGYGIAISSVALSCLGYYAVVNAIAVPLGFSGWHLFGLNLIPLALGIAASWTIQYKEFAPRKFEIFPHLADRAAFKAGRDRMVSPVETADTPSMLPTYKYMARNGDSIRDRKTQKDSVICYVLESIGALTAIGFYLGSSNPVIQIGALFWGAYSVFGCEFGLGHAEKSAAECLDASQERDYRVEKARLSP